MAAGIIRESSFMQYRLNIKRVRHQNKDHLLSRQRKYCLLFCWWQTLSSRRFADVAKFSGRKEEISFKHSVRGKKKYEEKEERYYLLNLALSIADAVGLICIEHIPTRQFMEKVYRNIVGTEEALRLQESSSLKLARENLRLVNTSITLYTGLLREIDSRLASCPHNWRSHYQGEKSYLETHIKELRHMHKQVVRIINQQMLRQARVEQSRPR